MHPFRPADGVHRRAAGGIPHPVRGILFIAAQRFFVQGIVITGVEK
jgi:hypothetical protein